MTVTEHVDDVLAHGQLDMAMILSELARIAEQAPTFDMAMKLWKFSRGLEAQVSELTKTCARRADTLSEQM